MGGQIKRPAYWHDINGNTIAQTTLNGTNQTEFVFFGGRRVARVNADGLVYYYQADQIGSTRSMTNSSGVRCYDADFPPYGTEKSYTGSCSPIYKFTGYERDTETGLDYAVNRYYNSRIGRFMTPDPAGLASASLGNPQSLNRYAFVLNNPLTRIDPLGLECVFISDDGSSVQEVDPTSNDYDSAECAGDGGAYISGNNEVNYDANGNTVAGANWANLSVDPNSDLVVRFSNGSGNLVDIGCAGGTGCTQDQLVDFLSGNNAPNTTNECTSTSCHVPNYHRPLSCDVDRCTPAQKPNGVPAQGRRLTSPTRRRAERVPVQSQLAF